MTASHRDCDVLKSEMLQFCLDAINKAKANHQKQVELRFSDGELEYLPIIYPDLERLEHAFYLDGNTFKIWNLYPGIISVVATARKQLTDRERQDIASRYSNGESMIALASDYKRSREAIRKVIKAANFR